uniref:Doublecortin domain-containing protein n=1 Tax=Mastacembelus armatus TaxID=205130 RepID=A0A7N9B1J1_9TELE
MPLCKDFLSQTKRTKQRLPPKMSTNKRSFQCFNTVGGEDAHRSSASFKHHTSHLPRIPRHGMVGHHEPLEECYLCSEYRHAQAWDALETQVSPLYHTHTPHHHHHPHRYVHSGATEPEAAHSGQDHHIHHHRYNKRMMLVKNSDPSLRKTIILHRRNLRSFGLFLEEVSELMQYHIRKLYTLDGHKIDNVQSLMQCPSVLVCVGREPSHPSIVESFRKTSDDTLPKLSMRSRVSGCLPMKKSAINPKTDKVTDNRRSASSDKSLPDGTDSPDHVDSYPPTGEGIGDDDIEKRVRVNKDGSLSMEMKVRFRLQNDETLHWSTEVRKSTGKTREYLQGHNIPYFSQVSDRSYSESENISAGEQDKSDITRHYQRNAEKPHCPHLRSNMSGTTAGKSLHEETDENNSTKSNNLKSSYSPNEGITKDKSERAPRTTSANSTMSLRSKTSKVCVSADENTEEERTFSPVSAKSNQSDTLSRSEVPAVTVEETEDRVPTVMSSKSKVSARSRKSGAKEKTSEGWSQSSLSVKSNLSMKSRKSKETNTLTDEQVENKEEMKISTEGPAKQKTTVVNTDAKNKSTSDLHEEEKPEPVDKRSCHSKTSSSSRQNSKNATAEIIAKPISASSDTCQGAQQPKGNNRHVISHTESNESDLSLTTYNSDVVEKLHESTGTGESKSNVSKKKKSGPLEATDTGRRVTDNKSDNSSKCRHKTTDADDFELAPSSLPNASPTEVVNEWLKTIPTDSDMFDMEEFNENYDVQETGHTTEEIKGMDANENNVESATESTKDTEEEVMNSVPNNDCQTSTEAPNEDNTEQDDASKMFHSSVQVMKVLLNPKLDRCNSLPEISPVYGRKLSTSARGLLDCLVKLQLIDHDPKNANEKDERYQELMNILQSLWLCDRPESEHVLKEDQHHFLDDEFNHTSSSGVDVNSGSTVSGKSSDGVNCDVSQPHTAANALMTVQEVLEADTQWTHEREVEGMDEKNQKEDDPATDDTIRSNDSPRELPETPFSSNNSSENEGNGQNLPEEAEAECQDDTSSESPPLIHSAQLVKMISQDPNPVWVLTLLTKIEKQFMTHYINAMREFKARWNLVDDEQLDMMISELKTEVHKRIQTSIDRELRKLQGRAGLPRPPKETMSRTSTTQTVDRRRKLKIMLNQLTDPHAEKSDDSDTSYKTADTRKDDSKEETAEDNVTENVNVADDKDEETAEKTSMEDEISEEKEIAVTGEGEMVEEAGASMDEEDDTAEDVAETTEHESDEEEVVEGGTTEGATDEDEKILATGVDENVVMVKGDEQSKEETTTEDELADKDEAM